MLGGVARARAAALRALSTLKLTEYKLSLIESRLRVSVAELEKASRTSRAELYAAELSSRRELLASTVRARLLLERLEARLKTFLEVGAPLLLEGVRDVSGELKDVLRGFPDLSTLVGELEEDLRETLALSVPLKRVQTESERISSEDIEAILREASEVGASRIRAEKSSGEA
ncbi:MAG: hypothetical protein QXU52_05225 [Fervidicoccaceae archaeon]